MDAYVNGVQVKILSFFIRDDIPYCKVRVPENEWITNVPTSMVEIR